MYIITLVQVTWNLYRGIPKPNPDLVPNSGPIPDHFWHYGPDLDQVRNSGPLWSLCTYRRADYFLECCKIWGSLHPWIRSLLLPHPLNESLLLYSCSRHTLPILHLWTVTLNSATFHSLGSASDAAAVPSYCISLWLHHVGTPWISHTLDTSWIHLNVSNTFCVMWDHQISP